MHVGGEGFAAVPGPGCGGAPQAAQAADALQISGEGGERMSVGRVWIAIASAALVGVAGGAAAAGADREQTRALMRPIFESMSVLLPLSADPAKFADPAREPEVRAALRSLAANADALAAHASAADPDTRYLGTALGHDAREILRAYELGRSDGAIFFLQQTTGNCIACHSRLPHPGDSPVSEWFARDSSMAKLAPLQRGRLLVATRRFDQALAAFESVFADPKVHPAETLSAWTDYLVVSLRALQDFARPVPALEKFAARPDVWENLRADLREWIASVRELAPSARAEPSLGAARELLEQGDLRTRFPADRRALVQYIAASGILHRWLAAHPEAGKEAGEAWYLLGLAELHISRDYWVSQADFFLETSIRTEPRGKFARDAYALLEQETLLGYTGSSGMHLPDDVRRHLAELKKLIAAP
jgi:hypothetical protein